MNRWNILLALTVPLLAACSQGQFGAKHGIRDADVEDIAKQNTGPAHIITMPDQFENVAFKCDRKNGIYTTTRQAAPVIVPNDPNCTG